TDAEAHKLATSLQLQFWGLRRGTPFPLRKPVDPSELEEMWTPQEREIVSASVDPFSTIIGSKETVQAELKRFKDETNADEIIIDDVMYDQEASIRSYEIVHELEDS